MWSPAGLVAVMLSFSNPPLLLFHKSYGTSIHSHDNPRLSHHGPRQESVPWNPHDVASTLALEEAIITNVQNDNNQKPNMRVHDVSSHDVSRRQVIELSLFLSTIVANGSTVQAAHAITSQEAESSYNQYASNYDLLDGGSIADSLGIEKARDKLISKMARGNVLEVGVGTGLNLGKYRFASSPDATEEDGVTGLTLLDVSEGMMSQAREKISQMDVPEYVPVRFVKADATVDLTRLFGVEGCFDTVVDTFSLCVMGNDGAKECLKQMQQVVKKDSGRILLMENTRSSNAVLGWYQDWTAEAAAKMGGKGCVSNQNVREFIQTTPGLELMEEEELAGGDRKSVV